MSQRWRRVPSVEDFKSELFSDLDDKEVENTLKENIKPLFSEKIAALPEDRIVATLKRFRAKTFYFNASKKRNSDPVLPISFLHYLNDALSPLWKAAASRPFSKEEAELWTVENWLQGLNDSNRSELLQHLDVLVKRDVHRFVKDNFNTLYDSKVFNVSDEIDQAVKSIESGDLAAPTFVDILAGSGFDNFQYSLTQANKALAQLSELCGKRSNNIVLKQQKMREIRQHLTLCCDMMREVATGKFKFESASMRYEAQEFLKKYQSLLEDVLGLKNVLGGFKAVSRNDIDEEQRAFYKIYLQHSKTPVDIPPVSKAVIDEAISHFVSLGYSVTCVPQGDSAYRIVFRNGYEGNPFVHAYALPHVDPNVLQDFVNKLKELDGKCKERMAKEAGVKGNLAKESTDESASAAGNLANTEVSPTDDSPAGAPGFSPN